MRTLPRVLSSRVYFVGLVLAGTATAQPPVYDVPRLDGITIDGNAADWGNRGFRVELMADQDGRVKPKADFDSSFRLGWDSRGLLVLLSVHDNLFIEDREGPPWDSPDSVDLFAASEPGARDFYGLVVSPGMSPEVAQLRAKDLDWQAQPRASRTYEAARTKMDGGYILEVLLAWTNLEQPPKEGGETAFQLVVHDVDDRRSRFNAVWYPQVTSEAYKKAMFRIRLARKASSPDCARVLGEYDDTARTHVTVLTVASFAGKGVEVREGRHVRARAALTPAGDYVRAELRFPMPGSWGRNENSVPDVKWHVCAKAFDVPLELPDADVVRAQRIMLLSMAAKPPVFWGNRFPACDFAEPLLAEQLIGPYRIDPTFYDQKFNPVTNADGPGRYGAIVEVKPESGPAFRRYLTLFCAPGWFNTLFAWWTLDPRLSMRLPDELRLDRSVVAAESESLGAYVKNKVLDDLFKGQDAAVLFAGLYEAQPGQAPVTVTDDVWAADRQWWVTLKRKLNGMDKTYPNPFVCPRPKEGSPAPVLREGTPAEAGMKPDAADKIDAVCQEWSSKCQEPFAVCLARHGVVFFQKAYGMRYGEPMTLDTESWMASISKFISAQLTMMLVDQGLVDLDAPIDQYLPALRGIPVKCPLTIRHLYTHTSGLGMGLQQPRKFIDHWGDELNDFEEIVAGYYPYLEVGARHAYNGAGHALGGKIIESISGEALPQFFKKHLWDPLGCEHTDAMDGSARTMSTPLDIARFGQMLLNRGAYGDQRFFSEATFEKMLPVKLAPYVHFDTNLEWGIGPVWTREPGLSKRTFGHGAASAATLRIDPENDLIIVMCRNSAGSEGDRYHPQFIHAIVEGMAKDARE